MTTRNIAACRSLSLAVIIGIFGVFNWGCPQKSPVANSADARVSKSEKAPAPSAKNDTKPTTKKAATPKPATPAPPAEIWRRHAVPLIDSHVHIIPLPASVRLADHIFQKVNIQKFAMKSAGKVGSARYQATKQVAAIFGDKTAFFINLDWRGIDDRNWGKREAKKLAIAMKEGASGIKIFKALGLGVRHENGSLLKVDDRRLDPIFKMAAKTKAIIAWHVADPVAFFDPITKKNERYDELSQAPEWSFHGQDFPSHKALLAARDRVLKRHPKTIFLGIHLANHPESLDYVAKLLDTYPNLHVDTSARIPEIGRHPPKKTRAFFIKYQDRIMFGSDLIITPSSMQLGSVSEKPPTVKDAIEFYALHRRFFETHDRQFAHPTPIQGRWKIDGIGLSPDVLRKIYYTNADKLIFEPRRAWLKKNKATQPIAPVKKAQ
jgi:predicted TIM-barrel fold metal-dependent hydrolase